MPTRKKSFNDIVAQYHRIEELSSHLANRDGVRAALARNTGDPMEYVQAYNDGAQRVYDRSNKAYDVAYRYIQNIKGKKSYQNLKNKAKGKSFTEREELQDKAHSRKYSQSSYASGGKG